MAETTPSGKTPFKTGRAFFLYAFWCGVSPLVSFSWQVCRVCEKTQTNVCFRVEKTQKNPWSRVGPTKVRGVLGFSLRRVGWRERIFNIGSGFDYHDGPKPGRGTVLSQEWVLNLFLALPASSNGIVYTGSRI